MQNMAGNAIEERRLCEASEAGRRQKENFAYPQPISIPESITDTNNAGDGCDTSG